MNDRTVRYFDLSRLHASIRPDLDAAFDETVRSSSFVGARTSLGFENQFAAITGRTHAVGVGSGTDALALALRALGVGPGDEVIVPANTFAATAEAVVHVGADPVFADVDADLLLVTASTVAEVIGPRTAAVIPVHLYGHVVDLDCVTAWRDAGLAVIEDAAQAHLASWRDRAVGEAGHVACYSFFPGKNLGALGDAGAATTDDAEIAERMTRLRDHGRSSKDEHEEIGWCTRLDGLQAALLTAKLAYLRSWTERRVEIAELYRDALDGAPNVDLVPWSDGAVHHTVVARVGHRDNVAAQLANAGIETGIHYRYALTQQRAFAKWTRTCPNAEAAAGQILSVPCDPLMSDDDVAYVAHWLRKVTSK